MAMTNPADTEKPDMTEGAEDFTAVEVQMTEAEFEAMPEYQG